MKLYIEQASIPSSPNDPVIWSKVSSNFASMADCRSDFQTRLSALANGQMLREHFSPAGESESNIVGGGSYVHVVKKVDGEDVESVNTIRSTFYRFKAKPVMDREIAFDTQQKRDDARSGVKTFKGNEADFQPSIDAHQNKIDAQLNAIITT